VFLFLGNERANQPENRFRTNINDENEVQPKIPDSSTMRESLITRLDLPVSQRLLSQNFKLEIIKRCWKDQILLKSKLSLCLHSSPTKLNDILADPYPRWRF
jgi:hypothetical protein